MPEPEERQPATPGTDADADASRPAVAIIANVNAPYRLHQHLRVAREMREVALWSLFTHDQSEQPWDVAMLDEIRPVHFGKNEPVTRQDRVASAPREWARGGRIIRFLRARGVRAVVVNGYNDAGRLRVVRWCRRHGVPAFLWTDSNIHSDRAAGLKRTIKKILVGRVLSWFTGYLPCGTLGAAYFRRYGADPSRIWFFPVEPDYDLIASLTPERVREAMARLGLDPTRKRVVQCGRLVRVKRPDLAIDAFARVARERPEWDLLMIGDGPLRASLEARVPADLRPRVIFAGFLRRQEDVSAVYRASQVLLLPSEYEPWALVVNEAAAAGMAIVSSDVVGASAELVRDGVNGRIVRAGDLEGLTGALREVTSPGVTERMRAASGPILAEWRRRGDLVQGLRAALKYAGVI